MIEEALVPEKTAVTYNPFLALNVPCPKCKVPDSWYESKEEGRYTRFSFKCHWCSHGWVSTRDHVKEEREAREAKRKKTK